jgi:hypothetical protein
LVKTKQKAKLPDTSSKKVPGTKTKTLVTANTKIPKTNAKTNTALAYAV